MEQLNLDNEDGWQHRAREQRMAEPSLIRFVFRGLEITYQDEQRQRTEMIERLKGWFPGMTVIQSELDLEINVNKLPGGSHPGIDNP